LRTRGQDLRFFRFRGCKHAHPDANQRKRSKERETKKQQSSLCPGARSIARGLMAQAQIFTFNLIGILAFGAGRKDTG
jgi:hypothetical protein